MTARRMKIIDLRRWNLVQAILVQRLGMSAEPEIIMAFSEWFANEVDHLHRLPRFSETQMAKTRYDIRGE